MSELCCEALDRLSTKYPASLDLSVQLMNIQTGEDLPPTWVLRLYKYTESGRISTREKDRGWVFMLYCPFCGARLVPMKKEGSDE